MKTCLIQSACRKYLPYQQQISPLHSRYCARHSIDYMVYLGDVQTQFPPSWNRIPLIEFALQQGNDLVVWMDTDSLIVDHSVNLKDCTTEFKHVGMCIHRLPWEHRDWHWNAGVSFYKNTPKVRRFLKNTRETGEQHDSYQWYEQHVMMMLDLVNPIIQQIDDRWNSTVAMNECPNPVVKSWHGQWDLYASEIASYLARLTGH